MNKKRLVSILLLIVIASLLIVSIVEALTVTKITNDLYFVNFSNGRSAYAYNINYVTSTKQLSFYINTTDHKGLRMIDMLEIRDYCETLKGRTGQKDRTTIIIR